MNDTPLQCTPMHQGAQQGEMRACAYCRTLFEPKKRWAAFCKPECRTAFDVDFGATGRVVTVRKLKTGVSLILRATGPAAERLLNLTPGDQVRAVKQP
jgi:hypothetical protein